MIYQNAVGTNSLLRLQRIFGFFASNDVIPSPYQMNRQKTLPHRTTTTEITGASILPVSH